MKLPKFEKNNKLFWLYIVLGAIVTIFAIIFAPFWSSVNVPWKNWSQSILNLIIATFLSLYLFGFLIKKVIRTKGQTLKVLTIIEFVLLFLIDLYLVLGQWIPSLNIIKVNGACAITGLALYVRGVVELFRAYFYHRETTNKYPIWWLCIAIGFVSFGMWMLVAPFIQDIVIIWIFVTILFVVGILLIVYGIYAKPQKKKQEKKVTKNK